MLALFPNEAGSHPVDEVVQGAYLTLVPGALRLELNLTAGTEVANTVLASLDMNADQRITEAEARAYAQGVLERSSITLDGVRVSWTLENVRVPPYRNLQLGTDTIKIYAVDERPDRSGAHTLSYHNQYQPAKSQWTANVFLEPGAGWQYQVSGQRRSDDGQQLTVNYVARRP